MVSELETVLEGVLLADLSDLPVPAPEHDPLVLPDSAKEVQTPKSVPISLIPKGALKALNAVKIERAPRVASLADVEIRIGGLPNVRGVARDMSATGVFVATRGQLPIDDIVTLSLALKSDTQWDVQEHKVMARVVRRVIGVGYGLRFEEKISKGLQKVLDRLDSSSERKIL